MEEIQWLRKIGMLEYIFHLWSVYPPPTYITLEVYQINIYLGFPNEYVAFCQDGCTPYTEEREQAWHSKDYYTAVPTVWECMVISWGLPVRIRVHMDSVVSGICLEFSSNSRFVKQTSIYLYHFWLHNLNWQTWQLTKFQHWFPHNNEDYFAC